MSYPPYPAFALVPGPARSLIAKTEVDGDPLVFGFEERELDADCGNVTALLAARVERCRAADGQPSRGLSAGGSGAW